MDTPPQIPPIASTPPTPAPSASDQKLLKRASHAGRNLSLLALLASVGAVALITFAFIAKGMHGVMATLAATMTMIATGYWTLAVAARRGNPNAVGVVIVAMGFQICLALIARGIAAARTNSPFELPVAGMFIPVLVLLALVSSRQVLLQLKQRNLWDQVFASAKPSANLCLIGGALLGAGLIAFNAGTYYIGWKSGEQRRAEFEHARAFVQLVQGSEQEFLTAWQAISVNGNDGDIEAALSKFKSLEQNFEVLKKESAGAEQLLRILTTYGNALRQWKNGLMLMKERNADTDRAQQMFKLGDQLRAEALQEFDRRYAPRKPKPEI